MPLPKENSAWPPAEWVPAFDQFRLNDIMWSGSVEDLAGGGAATRGDDPNAHYNKPRNKFGKLLSLFQFWNSAAESDKSENRTRVHGPLSTNIATLSASTLMSAPPQTVLTRDGDIQKGPAQDRVDLICNGEDQFLRLVEAAEEAAGLSGVILTANWDRDKSDKPWTEVSPCDAAIPEYVLGHLFAINLWTTHEAKTMSGSREAIFYHVERHESGKIIHALYKGTDDSIGDRVHLANLEDTEALLGIRGATYDPETFVLEIPTGITELTASYWRNLRTRRFRKDALLNKVGRADTEGLEGMLDQYDMLWSSWMRDIKLARARLIVPEAYMESTLAGGGGTFDDDQEIVTALAYTELSDGSSIRAEQFNIRAEEHSNSLLAITKEILQGAGYSMSSYNGGDGGGAPGKTATEVMDDTTTTERTRRTKSLYYKQAGVAHNRALLELDRVHYRGPGIAKNDVLDIVFEPLSSMDPEKEARIVSGWHAAQSATVATRVAFLHPEWDKEQIDKERETIYLEYGIGVEEDPALDDRTPPGEKPPGDEEADDAEKADEALEEANA